MAFSTIDAPNAAARERVGSSCGRLRCDFAIPVATHDGHNTEQPIWSVTNDKSWCRVSDSDTTACLATLYGPINGGSISPAIEAVLITRPR